MARHGTGGTHLVVAAIDFGTTYSGYAYSFRDDFIKDPLKVYTNQQWRDEDSNLVTFKAPTSILFDDDRKFRAFGFAAESTYSQLVDENVDKGWRLFRRFKMSLYRGMKIEGEDAAAVVIKLLIMRSREFETMYTSKRVPVRV